MRHSRLVLPALAFVVAGTWSTQALACDKDKATTTTAAAEISAAYMAEIAAKCTPEMAAARKAKGAKATAVTAAMTSDHCASKGGKATAVTAAMTSDHCASKGAKATAVLAGAGAACRTKGKTTAATAGAACRGNGMATMAGKTAHGDCDACADMAICHDEIESAGVRTQVVPLKNGVMFVYTTETQGKVSMVQSAMARRSERLTQLVTAGDRARLCSECKSLRGAMASGKLQREVVNIEGGALTLMTSSDASVVAKIHTMVEHHKSGRAKS